MSAAKEIWLDDIDEIVNEFVAECVGRDEAVAALVRKGLHPFEAAEMLDRAVE